MLEIASRIHSEREGVNASHARDEPGLPATLPLLGAMLFSHRAGPPSQTFCGLRNGLKAYVEKVLPGGEGIGPSAAFLDRFELALALVFDHYDDVTGLCLIFPLQDAVYELFALVWKENFSSLSIAYSSIAHHHRLLRSHRLSTSIQSGVSGRELLLNCDTREFTVLIPSALSNTTEAVIMSFPYPIPSTPRVISPSPTPSEVSDRQDSYFAPVTRSAAKSQKNKSPQPITEEKDGSGSGSDSSLEKRARTRSRSPVFTANSQPNGYNSTSKRRRFSGLTPKKPVTKSEPLANGNIPPQENGHLSPYSQIKKSWREFSRSPSPLGLIPLHRHYRYLIHKHEVPRKALHVSIGFFALHLYTRGTQARAITPWLFGALVPIASMDLLRHRYPAVNRFLHQKPGSSHEGDRSRWLQWCNMVPPRHIYCATILPKGYWGHERALVKLVRYRSQHFWPLIRTVYNPAATWKVAGRKLSSLGSRRSHCSTVLGLLRAEERIILQRPGRRIHVPESIGPTSSSD